MPAVPPASSAGETPTATETLAEPPLAPEIACRPSGEARTQSLPAAALRSDQTLGFGARAQSLPATGLSVHGWSHLAGSVDNPFDWTRSDDPEYWKGVAKLRVTVTFIQPFDLEARVHERKLKLAAVDLGDTGGLARPSLTFGQLYQRELVSVLSHEPGGIAGVALKDHRVVVVLSASHQKVTTQRKRGHDDTDHIFVLQHAVSSKKRVTGLFTFSSDAFLADIGSDKPLDQFRPDDDYRPALGLDESNQPVVVELAFDPKLPNSARARVRRSGKPGPHLASWSTLRTADDPDCVADRSGVRFVMGEMNAIRLRDSGNLSPASGQLMLLRWNEARVCLEAAQLAAYTPTFDSSIPYYVVRYVAPLGAVRLHFDSGVESRQPAACRFVPLNSPS